MNVTVDWRRWDSQEEQRRSDHEAGRIRALQTVDDLKVITALTAGLRNDVVVELGAWVGGLTAWLALELIPRGCTIHAVDTFQGTTRGGNGTQNTEDHEYAAGRDVRGEFENNLRRLGLDGKVHVHVEDTPAAARHFRNDSCGFVFVDADHRADAVERDVLTWWPKVRPGGVLAGHDVGLLSVRLGLYKCWKYENIGPFSRKAQVWWVVRA